MLKSVLDAGIEFWVAEAAWSEPVSCKRQKTAQFISALQMMLVTDMSFVRYKANYFVYNGN